MCGLVIGLDTREGTGECGARLRQPTETVRQGRVFPDVDKLLGREGSHDNRGRPRLVTNIEVDPRRGMNLMNGSEYPVLPGCQLVRRPFLHRPHLVMSGAHSLRA